MIQSVMDSNLIGFDKWINSSEEYTEQENNIEILKETLSYIEQEDDSSTDTEIDSHFKSLVESHPNFFKFVPNIQFDDYIRQFTLKPNSSSDTNSDDLIFRLALAVSNPNVIDLITENFIKN